MCSTWRTWFFLQCFTHIEICFVSEQITRSFFLRKQSSVLCLDVTFFLESLFVYLLKLVRAFSIVTACVKWYKGQILHNQLQKSLISVYASIMQNSFLLIYLCKYVQVFLCIFSFLFFLLHILKMKQKSRWWL